MKIDFTLQDRIEYNKIFIFGSGFSLDMFDLNQIDDKSIIISINSSLCVLPRIDYYIASNWNSFRPELLNYLPPKTKMLCYSGLSTQKQLEDYNDIDNEIKETVYLEDILTTITNDILKRQPIIIHYYINDKMLKNKQYILEQVKNGVLMGFAGTSTPAFTLAYFLSKQYNINQINYIGFDFIGIKQSTGTLLYPYCLNHVLSHIPNSYVKHPAKFKYSNIDDNNIALSQLHIYQLIPLLLIASIDIDFYNKLKSQSALNISQIPFPTLQSILSYTLQLFTKYNTTYITKQILDEALIYIQNNHPDILDNLKSNLKSLDKNVRIKPVYTKYKPPKIPSGLFKIAIHKIKDDEE